MKTAVFMRLSVFFGEARNKLPIFMNAAETPEKYVMCEVK